MNPALMRVEAGVTGTALSRSFYARESAVVAPDLLNKVLIVGAISGRIVEVEAYGGSDDPASHAYLGRTARNGVMFGQAGHLYTYFTYGMHWCANAVCGPNGRAGAVLLRALAPIAGVEEMFERRRAATRPVDLCSGPAKLCQALGIGAADDGVDLLGDAITIVDDGIAPPTDVVTTRRIGVTKGTESLWRFHVPGDPNVSRSQRRASSDRR